MSNTTTTEEKELGDYNNFSTSIIHQHPRHTYQNLSTKSQIGFLCALKEAHGQMIGHISGQNNESC